MNLRQSLLAIAMAAGTTLAAISYSPVTPGATESAQKLYNLLATNFERKTISGIQTGEINTSANLTSQADLQAVFNASGGKYPALVGFDFLFANGVSASNSWNQEYTRKTISLAIELWKNGGIPAFSWHWKDPSDSVDAFYVQGAGTPYTTFDFTKAFQTGTTDWNTSSPTYAQIISDIDEISTLFETLQDSGVAAIFRPLHECGGAWFWWNTKSGAQYAALYRLVYTRMTTINNIKNLVWVWNPQVSIFTQPAWNPGATYYDVIGVDIYNSAFDYKSNVSAFNSMKTNYGTNKILTLSENGPIPDASLMHADGAIWSWYMPWYESWSGGFVSKTKNTVWTANLASPCVYTLDKMPGWSNYSISNTPVTACQVGYQLGNLDTAVQVAPVTLDTSNGNGWMQVVVTNMRTQVDANGDTTVPAAANLYIVPSTNLSGAATASLTAYNTSNSGVWMSLAVLTDGDWNWEMPPEGCWLNAGDSTVCTFDVSAMSMDNIAKMYIMIATEGYSGTLYFDDFITDKGLVASFNTASDLFRKEQIGAETYVTTLALIGGGSSTPISGQYNHTGTQQISLQGKNLMLSLNQTSKTNLELYDLNGHRVTQLHHGNLNHGTHRFDISSIPNGLYVVRATGSFGVIAQKIIVK